MAIRHYWSMVAAAVGFRLVLVLFGGDLHLASRPEVSTPLTSLRRLAEGYWLKQASMSPYSGLAPLAAFGYIMAIDYLSTKQKRFLSNHNKIRKKDKVILFVGGMVQMLLQQKYFL